MKTIFSQDKVDMHIHTDYSDGYESPKEIIRMAYKNNIKEIAITDHDTMEAFSILDIKNIKKEYGIILHTGVEISAIYNNHLIHLLAYDINPTLFKKLSKLVYRKDEKRRMYNMSAGSAKKLVHLLGGKIILAHPFKYYRDEMNGRDLVESIIKDKLVDGIEVFHSYHNKEEVEYLISVVEKNNLYASIGSDFHYFERKVRGTTYDNKLGYLPVIDMNSDEIIDKYIKNNKMR